MQAQTKGKKYYSVEEYILMEAAATYKSEFHEGKIIAMAGGSVPHNSIGGNIFAAFKTKLRGKTCKPHNSDQAIAVEEGERYVYPDVSVVCGKDIRSKKFNDAISNPVMAVEVLSKETSDYDRGEKFRRYLTIETFKEYVIVAQDKILVEVLTKIDKNEWRFVFYKNINDTILLNSIDTSLSLSEIYEDIVFEK